MKKRLVAGNWKMNLVIEQARLLSGNIVRNFNNADIVDVVLIPPFTSLCAVSKELEGTEIQLGAQNVSWKDSGEYTGEISAPMLRDIGCDWVLVGHSERRHVMGETNATIGKKLEACFRAGLKAVLCVGETNEERLNAQTKEIVETQLRSALDGLAISDPQHLTIAYEPVWAIGTGNLPSIDGIKEIHSFIRHILSEIGLTESKDIRILYGGSVNVGNIKQLLVPVEVNGVLVGGASLNADSFIEIINSSG